MNQKTFAQRTAQVVQRAYDLNIKGRKQGLSGLINNIDTEGLKNRDVFELGIQLLSDGVNPDFINNTLSNMINIEQNEFIRRLKTIQKEAVLRIHEGLNSWLLLHILLSYVSENEKKDIQGLLKDEVFSNFFSMI